MAAHSIDYINLTNSNIGKITGRETGGVREVSNVFISLSIFTKLKMLFYKMRAVSSRFFIIFMLPLEQSFKKMSSIAKNCFSEI